MQPRETSDLGPLIDHAPRQTTAHELAVVTTPNWLCASANRASRTSTSWRAVAQAKGFTVMKKIATTTRARITSVHCFAWASAAA